MYKNDVFLIVAVLIVLGAIELIALVLAGATSSEVAAWVEAFGVLAAFGGSIYLARRSERFARQQRLADRHHAAVKRLTDLDRLVFKIQSFANDLPSWVLLTDADRMDAKDVRAEQAQVLSELLDGVEILALPDFTLTALLADMRARMRRIASHLNAWTEAVGMQRELWLREQRALAEQVAGDLKSDCNDYLRVSGYFLVNGVPPD